MAVGEIAVAILVEAIAKATVDGASELGALLSRGRQKTASKKATLIDELRIMLGLISWLQNSSMELLSQYQDVGNIIDGTRLGILIVRTRAYLREDRVFNHLFVLTKTIQASSKKKYAKDASDILKEAVGLFFEYRSSLLPPRKVTSRTPGLPVITSAPLETGVLWKPLSHLLEQAEIIYENYLGAPIMRIETARSPLYNDNLARFNQL